jgi:predicted nucleotidyltransferase
LIFLILFSSVFSVPVLVTPCTGDVGDVDNAGKRAQSFPMQQDKHQQIERYRVNSLGLFGSYVRREQRPESDIDLLVAFDDPPSLLKFIELENYLTDLLGVKVDLVLKDALKPMIEKRILSEVVQV